MPVHPGGVVEPVQRIMVTLHPDECLLVVRGHALVCARPDHRWPSTLRIGCHHPARYDITALGDPAQLWRCDTCGAEWFTLWRGYREEWSA